MVSESMRRETPARRQSRGQVDADDDETSRKVSRPMGAPHGSDVVTAASNGDSHALRKQRLARVYAAPCTDPATSRSPLGRASARLRRRQRQPQSTASPDAAEHRPCSAASLCCFPTTKSQIRQPPLRSSKGADLVPPPSARRRQRAGHEGPLRRCVLDGDKAHRQLTANVVGCAHGDDDEIADRVRARMRLRRLRARGRQPLADPRRMGHQGQRLPHGLCSPSPRRR